MDFFFKLKKPIDGDVTVFFSLSIRAYILSNLQWNYSDFLGGLGKVYCPMHDQFGPQLKLDVNYQENGQSNEKSTVDPHPRALLLQEFGSGPLMSSLYNKE